MSNRGISPAQVAGDNIDAMCANRFRIFTHPATQQALAVRYAEIEAGRNPTNPYEGISLFED